MKTTRQADSVTWWRMGRSAVARYGYAHALEMASDIMTEGNRRLFLAGANGEPRPTVRRPPPFSTYRPKTDTIAH